MNRTANQYRRDKKGSTLVVALLMLLVLSAVGANLLLSVSTRYDNTQKAIGWEKALPAAEAGAEVGLANVRWSVTGAATPWSGWKKSVSGFWTTVTDAADASTELSAGRKVVYDLPAGSHLTVAGEGSTDLWYHVEVDAPASMVVGGNPWYRIRSTGYAGLPGMARANYDLAGSGNHNDLLRKLDLKSDHFIKRYGDYANAVGTSVAVTPRAARRIELIAKPKTGFGWAIFATAPSGSPVSVPIIDSYNSGDTVNYPGGLYSSTPRNVSTGVGTNAPIYINAPISTLSGNYYGNVQTNGGTLTKTANISGTVANNLTQAVPTVGVPSWAGVAGSAAPATLSAGTTAAPLYASYTSVSGLTVNLPAGKTTGVANIYVTGNVSGGISVAKGVTLRVWFAGSFSMKASAVDNQNNNPAYLQLYGIDPPAGQTRSVSLGSGPPGYRYFVLDAPAYDFSVNGNPDFCGAFIVKTLSGNGNTTWHYDEALANTGLPTDYTRAMWVEDER